MAPALPTGTVTLLFTDIEGSTRMLQELGRDRYVRALMEHRRLLRDAFTRHGGVEVEMQGDSFFFAFPFARDAVAAAAAGQRALRHHSWEVAPIRVRIGLHTGEPMQADGLYAGLDVHRAARVMSAGHGGQVLVSERTADLVDGELPEGVTLRSLGSHRLKDFSEPQLLYDVAVDGLPDAFPPPKTLEARATNLPTVSTALVGRAHEVAELAELLGRPDVRLVTLLGPAGAGKTRLALQVAGDAIGSFDDGVFFVPLAPLRRAELILSAIAKTLGIREHAGEPIAETLAEFLRNRDVLLVLDNFEHLLKGAVEVRQLLSLSSGTKVLATSRARLQVSGEHDYAVFPLALPEVDAPPEAAALLEYDAVRLFAERARSADREFALTDGNAPTVAEICRRLDGLPLAIELAAARTPLLSPQALLQRLDRRLSVLTGGPQDLDERQRTIRGAIAWSYELLEPAERDLFVRFSVFAGGAELDAVDAVGDTGESDALGVLESLVGKSLLRRQAGHEHEPRLWMLETVREFAAERLEHEGLLAATAQRHAAHFLALAEAAEPELKGPAQRTWLDRLERDHDNLRASLAFALEADAETALRLVGSLWRFWDLRGHHAEGAEWTRRALAQAGGTRPSRARALASAAWLEWLLGDPRASEQRSAEAYDLFEELGEVGRAASSLVDRGWALFERDRETGRSLAEQGLARARAVGDRWVEGYAMQLLAGTAEDGASADALGAASDALFQELGDESMALASRSNRGWFALEGGRFDEAGEISASAAATADRLGDRYLLVSSLNNAASANLLRGDVRSARVRLAESLTVLGSAPTMRLAAEALTLAAALSADDRELDRTGRHFGAASAVFDRSGHVPSSVERRLVGEWIEPMRDSQPEAFARSFAAGAATTISDALEEALDGLSGG